MNKTLLEEIRTRCYQLLLKEGHIGSGNPDSVEGRQDHEFVEAEANSEAEANPEAFKTQAEFSVRWPKQTDDKWWASLTPDQQEAIHAGNRRAKMRLEAKAEGRPEQCDVDIYRSYDRNDFFIHGVDTHLLIDGTWEEGYFQIEYKEFYAYSSDGTENRMTEEAYPRGWRVSPEMGQEMLQAVRKLTPWAKTA